MPQALLDRLTRLALWGTTGAAMVSGCALLRVAQRPADNATAPRTPAAVARGEYLVTTVLDCAGCHAGVNPSTRAVDRSLPMVGGGVYGHSNGLPGEIPVPNITQAPRSGLGNWTDGEIMRAIREGVDRKGQPLFPIMPYPEYAHMSDADTRAVVAYLRTLPPVEHEVPARKLDFPVNLFVYLIPKPLHRPVPPPPPDPVKRGAYVAQLSGCAGCHSPFDNHGQVLKGKEMAGGHRIHFLTQPANEPAIILPNITQDKQTGIGAWSDDEIKRAITAGRRPDDTFLDTSMPWLEFSRLSPEDVDALVAYLRTVKPVKNKVPRPSQTQH